MNFKVYGPFTVPRNDHGLISTDPADKRGFWDEVEETAEGLSGACGCYVFGLGPPGGGSLPWYVGRTKGTNGLVGECFQAHKINHYNNAIARYQRARPQLTLIAKVTPTTEAFAKPNANGHLDVEQFEDFLIGVAYAKNQELMNVEGTTFLRDVVIQGVLNSPGRGRPTQAATDLKRLLGL